MTRGIDAAVISHLTSNDAFRMATLVSMDFDGNTVYLTDYGQNVTATVNGSTNTYYATGAILALDAVPETSALRVNSFKLTCTGVDRVFVAYALTDTYLNSTVGMYRAIIDANGAVIGTPWSLFVGRIKGFTIEDDTDSSTVEFDIASHWADFEKVNCRRTTANSQKRYFPNDTGMDFAAKATKDMRWGRK